MDKKPAPKILKGFVRAIQRELHPEAIILFGSHARGDAGKWSDYDILVVSKTFKNVHPHDRAVSVLRFHPGTVPLDVVCYTPEEFNALKHAATLAREAAREGVQLTV